MLMIQMTGLPGAGKSTLATALKTYLEATGFAAAVIDADVYRKTISRDLGFSAADRRENIRRLASVAHAYQQQGVLAIIAAINPFEDVRAALREQYGAKTVWVRCELDVLVQRDPKGLYKKALLPANHPEKICNLTGINDPFELPVNADLVVDTSQADVETSTRQLLTFVLVQLAISRPPIHRTAL
jgi:adenylylsulfate kinase